MEEFGRHLWRVVCIAVVSASRLVIGVVNNYVTRLHGHPRQAAQKLCLACTVNWANQ